MRTPLCLIPSLLPAIKPQLTVDIIRQESAHRWRNKLVNRPELKRHFACRILLVRIDIEYWGQRVLRDRTNNSNGGLLRGHETSK